MLSKLRMALRALLRRSEVEHELDEELQGHLDQQTEQNIRLGMNPEEARVAALKAFGGVEQAKEHSRDARGVRWIEDLWQDMRYGSRMLVKSPGFTLVAVITLGLGIGVNTTIFSAMESLILHPFSLPNQNRLVVIYERNLDAGITRNGVAPGNLLDWRTQSKTFERFVSWKLDSPHLPGADQAERVFCYRVSAGFFAASGGQPVLGLDFQSSEDTGGRVR